MISIIICLTIVIYSVIPLVKWYRKRLAFVTAINKIPGSKTYPIIGSTYQLIGVDRKDIKKVFDGLNTKYPYIIRSWIGFQHDVNIRKAEYIESVINSSKHMEKSFFYDYVKIWLGQGLLVSDGEKWHKHRKIITPTFHFSILERFCEIFGEKSNILVEQLYHHADSGVSINIHKYVTRAALDIISESAMGIQIDSQRQHENEYVDAVYELTELIVYRLLRPYLAVDFIYKNTASGKQFKKCLNILHTFTKQVILNRKMAREENKQKGITPKKRPAFLDILLDVNEKENLLSDEDIREEVDTFMFEGHDTTAAGISWTLYILGLYPDIQQRVFEEMESIFHGTNRVAVLNDFNEMKYLERVIKESLRLYPPVPSIGRKLSEDVQLDQYKLPKGTTVTLGIYYLHRDPRFFGPDPEKFDPDRFLPENIKGRHPYAYIPFSAGPRNCIGQKFAVYEEKSVISSVVRNFKITSVEKRDEIHLICELILRTYKGINVKLEKRV